jgi:ribosome biogenesis GTPase A
MIKESILPIDYLVEQALIYLRNYKDLYFKKYDYELVDDVQTNLLNIAKRRMFMVGNNFDLDKASIALLRDFKNGHIGRMTLEKPE